MAVGLKSNRQPLRCNRRASGRPVRAGAKFQRTVRASPRRRRFVGDRTTAVGNGAGGQRRRRGRWPAAGDRHAAGNGRAIVAAENAGACSMKGTTIMKRATSIASAARWRARCSRSSAWPSPDGKVSRVAGQDAGGSERAQPAAGRRRDRLLPRGRPRPVRHRRLLGSAGGAGHRQHPGRRAGLRRQRPRGDRQRARPSDAALLGNGAEAAVRVNLPLSSGDFRLAPFAFGGVGWTYYSTGQQRREQLQHQGQRQRAS